MNKRHEKILISKGRKNFIQCKAIDNHPFVTLKLNRKLLLNLDQTPRTPR